MGSENSKNDEVKRQTVQPGGETSTARRSGETRRDHFNRCSPVWLSPSMLFNWRRAMEVGVTSGLKADVYSARPDRSFRRHPNKDSGVPEHGSKRSDGETRWGQCFGGVSPFFFRMEGPRSSMT
jgi:hypothetical protein